jgi:hypothetical protein
MFLSLRTRRILAPGPNSTRPTRSLAGLSPAVPKVSVGPLYHADNLLAQIFCHIAVRRVQLRARRVVGLYDDSVSARGGLYGRGHRAFAAWDERVRAEGLDLIAL